METYGRYGFAKVAPNKRLKQSGMCFKVHHFLLFSSVFGGRLESPRSNSNARTVEFRFPMVLHWTFYEVYGVGLHSKTRLF